MFLAIIIYSFMHFHSPNHNVNLFQTFHYVERYKKVSYDSYWPYSLSLVTEKKTIDYIDKKYFDRQLCRSSGQGFSLTALVNRCWMTQNILEYFLDDTKALGAS